MYIRRGPIGAHIVIILDLHRERHRNHNRTLSVCDERIRRYPKVSALSLHRGLHRDNPIGTYMIESEREI